MSASRGSVDLAGFGCLLGGVVGARVRCCEPREDTLALGEQLGADLAAAQHQQDEPSFCGPVFGGWGDSSAVCHDAVV
ncbi:MAG: hypothetical protein JWO74_1924 [Solirubrobacterales bacterium]|jgi:hypothetical protein|nr:hypothetical protein [Solirubrobacterales bacterium]